MREQYVEKSRFETPPFEHYLYELVMNGCSDEFMGDYDMGTLERLGRHVLECTSSGFIHHYKMHGHKHEYNFDLWVEETYGEHQAFRLREMSGCDWQEQYFVMKQDEKVDAALLRKNESMPDCHMMTMWTANGWNFYSAHDGSLVIEGV